MPSNNRVFYACQAVAFEPLKDVNGSLTPTAATPILLHGVQSVGINTTFNLEQVFELGQIHIYENIENVPDVEVTLEKVLDGYPLMYHVATMGVKDDPSVTNKATLVGRTKQRTNVYLGIYPDTTNSVSDVGTASTEVQLSGMYVSNISYTFPTDGNCTESLTLVGNHKSWGSTGSKFSSAVATQIKDNAQSIVAGFNVDDPKALQAGSLAGGIQRRENVRIDLCTLPRGIYGVNQNDPPTTGNAWANNKPTVHIQNISISCDLNRDSIQELGRKAPYARPANFPVEVTCEFEVLSVSGDFINAYENGDTTRFPFTDRNYGNNTREEKIIIILQDGSEFDLGSKNRLSSINLTGGDAGGGNASMTYSYSTFNNLSIKHPQDPGTAVRTLPGTPPVLAP